MFGGEMYRTHTINNESSALDNESSALNNDNVIDTLRKLEAQNQQNIELLEKNRVLLIQTQEREEEYKKLVESINKKKLQLISDNKKFNYETIIEWLEKLPQPDETPAGLAIQNFQMNFIDRDPKKAAILENRCYDIALTPVIPCNQWFSGRCWMFAGLNILRPYFINKYNLGPDFELSQAYLFFWHYLEQYESVLNLFYYEKMSEEEKMERLFNLLSDGGNWIIFRRLVEKYGVVPKKSYGESWQSKNSKEMNRRMSEMLAKDLQKCHEIKDSDGNYKDFIQECLIRAERVLSLCMGKPPHGQIIIRCKSKIPQNFQSKLPATVTTNIPLEDGLYDSPIDMFNDANRIYNIGKHVQLINDPRKKYNKWYKTQHQNLRAIPELFLNTNMDDIANVITKSIQKNIGVWFACNVNEDFSRKLQGMTKDLFRPDIFLDIDLKMSKIDRMKWGRARCNHAMLITGIQYERDKNNNNQIIPNQIAAFQVQNSWGPTGPGQGFYKMTKDWFDEHCYTAVVRHEFIDNLPNIPTDDKIDEYKYYDFFG